MKNKYGFPFVFRYGAFLLVTAFAAASVFGASYDCGEAKAPADKIVCENPMISRLDDALDTLYRETLAEASETDKKQLIDQQRHWLKHTRNVCRKEVCFKHAYWMRQAELAFFFQPKSPIYARESDKAEPIRNILAATSLSPGTLTYPSFCRQLLADLKKMKNIRFVAPLLQSMSYEDPTLDPWRALIDRKNGLGKPFTFRYYFDPSNSGDDVDTSMEYGKVRYGLPPYKLYELPPLKHSGTPRYIFYSDQEYGPTNREDEKPSFLKYAVFHELQSHLPGKSIVVSSDWLYGKEYNGIFEYRKRYFILILEPRAIDAHYSLTINFLDANAICYWSPAKD